MCCFLIEYSDGSTPDGCHPSPTRAARASAPSLAPPIHIGIEGFCNGLGENFRSAKFQRLLEYDGFSLVHNYLRILIDSLVNDPLSFREIPKASNSSDIAPTPTPRVKRPPEI